jgi:hypothetical protein
LELPLSRLLILLVALGIACHAQALPDAPSAWIALTVGTAAVTGIDAHQTVNGGRELWSPWLYGNYPSQHPARVAGIMAGEVVAASAAGYWLRSTRFRKFWWVPQLYVLAVHTAGMVHNYRAGLH